MMPPGAHTEVRGGFPALRATQAPHALNASAGFLRACWPICCIWATHRLMPLCGSPRGTVSGGQWAALVPGSSGRLGSACPRLAPARRVLLFSSRRSPVFVRVNRSPTIACRLGCRWPDHLVVVAGRDLIGVGERDVAHVGEVAGPPLPGGPEDVHQEALHEAWRHVHQEPVGWDIAERRGLQVEADRFEGPAFDQGPSFRFECMPEVADEVEEATAAGLLAPKLLEVTFDRGALSLSR
jgi:hypothetical protein